MFKQTKLCMEMRFNFRLHEMTEKTFSKLNLRQGPIYIFSRVLERLLMALFAIFDKPEARYIAHARAYAENRRWTLIANLIL